MARERKNAEAKVGQFGPKQIDSFFERTRRYFGIFQTELKAVAIVDNLLTEEMGQYGGQANRYACVAGCCADLYFELSGAVRSGSLRDRHQPLLHHLHHGW
jgi:hypothetical protein